MNLQKPIEEELQKQLSPHYLQVINESDQHAGPKGRQTHFYICLVSDAFNGLSRIARHQKVYQILDKWMSKPIHALSLQLFTRKEWQKKEGDLLTSPDCVSKSHEK